MTSGLRKLTACFVTVVALLLLYEGAYLPITKSHLYIAAYSNLRNVKSIDEFNCIFNPVLDYSSPVGQEELVSAYLGIVLDALNQNPPPPKEVAAALITQAEKRADPIIHHAPSFSYSQTILKLAVINKLAAGKQCENTKYYERARELFRLGLTYSPNRQAFLYNLLDLYLCGNDTQGTKEIVTIILKYWPGDQNAQRIWNYLENPTGAKK